MDSFCFGFLRIPSISGCRLLSGSLPAKRLQLHPLQARHREHQLLLAAGPQSGREKRVQEKKRKERSRRPRNPKERPKNRKALSGREVTAQGARWRLQSERRSCLLHRLTSQLDQLQPILKAHDASCTESSVLTCEKDQKKTDALNIVCDV